MASIRASFADFLPSRPVEPTGPGEWPLSDAVLEALLDAVAAKGIELYPAQEQAILELMADRHVLLATPTGSGKSLVAYSLVFRAVAQGKRVFYTAPIKALVSEKFFELCDEVGAQNVGMMTGDASINRDAPVICCTAEILANLSLSPRQGESIDFAIMDEFHYYGDRDRGVAWQLPLIARPDVQYLLMSATLGSTRAIEEDLAAKSGRRVVRVDGAERPVPLDYEWLETPVHESVGALVEQKRAPVYLVNFTQRQAAEQIQNLTSLDLTSKEDKKKISELLRGFRFDSPYGKDVLRFVRSGLGLHHAGLLPKYRRLVEQLAQAGLLRVVSGTDTLGVGINIPIRTVLFTRLFKFDGASLGLLSARDFKQIAGRAGRKGYDDRGTVACQAPDYVIENKRIEAKANANPQKRKKLHKKKPPEKGFVNWTKATFEELIQKEPEPLESRFDVTHSMVLQLIQAWSEMRGGGYRRLIELIAASHGSPDDARRQRRRARALFRSLLHARILSVVKNPMSGPQVVVDQDLQSDFSMNHSLSLYLLDALEQLEGEGLEYALDVLTLVESILEHPRAVLLKQVDKKKTELIGELKAAGVEYEERMEKLEQVEIDKPNAEFIYRTFNAFADQHPWVGPENIRPKSIARDLYERCMSFREYVREYGLQRSEGVLLRYLSDVYRTLEQNVPVAAKTEELAEISIFLRVMLERVDDSLVREWEDLVSGDGPEQEDGPGEGKPSRRFDPRRDKKAFLTRIRLEMQQVVGALAKQDYSLAAELMLTESETERLETARELESQLAHYFEDYGSIGVGPEARQTDKTTVREQEAWVYEVQQVLVDPMGDNSWVLVGEVRIDATTRYDAPLVRFVRVGT